MAKYLMKRCFFLLFQIAQLHFDSPRNEIQFTSPFVALLNRIRIYRYSDGNIIDDESKWRVFFPPMI